MPVKPVFEIDFEDKKCECCGKYKTSLNYLKTKSFMFPSGYSNICTECLGRRLEVDDSWEVMDKICQYLDMPFKIDLYEKLSKDNAPAALLQAYAMQMGSEEYEGIDWTSYQEAYKELENCCRILSREASIQNSNLMRKLSSEGKLPPGNASFDHAGAKNMDVLHDGMIPSLAKRVAEEIKKNPIDARVIGFDAKAKHEITLATRVQISERTYFSDPNLAALFEVHSNSIANWRKGIGTPEGFHEAFEKKDY